MEYTIEEQERAMAKEQLGVVEPSIENVSNKVLAMNVSNGIKYEFAKAYLVKQMDAIKINKPILVPVPTGEKDEEGNDLTEMVSEDREVESVFREGIVLKVPESLKGVELTKYNVGDSILFRYIRATDFDLLPGSALVDPFDVIGKSTKNE